MIIQLEQNLTEETLSGLGQQLDKIGIQSHRVTTQLNDYLVCVNGEMTDLRTIGILPGVKDIHRVNSPHQLVSRKWKVGRTAIDLGDGVSIGNNGVTLMGGPCSIENERQIESTVAALLENGVKIMRGGVYKPRTNPYSFRGLGLEGLKLFYKHCSENGIKVITEVMEASQIDDMLDYVDILQVGARNSQNFNLLDALGDIDKPVMIKRGISGSIDELLHSAEYVFKNGNEKIILCERGIRTFERASRNTLDLNAVPILREKSHLPIVVDPSHGIGIRQHVMPMALAGVAAGADGIIVEIHETPEEAATDAAQTLDFRQFKVLVEKVRSVEEALRS